MSTLLATLNTANVSINWREPYASAALNRGTTSQPRGIVRGFYPEPDVGVDLSLRLSVDPSTNDSVAILYGKDSSVDAGAYALVYRATADVVLDLSTIDVDEGGFIGLVHGYSDGATTASQWRLFSLTEWEAGDTGDAILVCQVIPNGIVEPLAASYVRIVARDDQWRNTAQGLQAPTSVVPFRRFDQEVFDPADLLTSPGVGITAVVDTETKWGVGSLKLTADATARTIALTTNPMVLRTGDRVLAAAWVRTEGVGIILGAGANENGIRLYRAATLVTSNHLMLGQSGPWNAWRRVYAEVVCPSDGLARLDFYITWESGDVFLDSWDVLVFPASAGVDEDLVRDDVSRVATEWRVMHQLDLRDETRDGTLGDRYRFTVDTSGCLLTRPGEVSATLRLGTEADMALDTLVSLGIGADAPLGPLHIKRMGAEGAVVYLGTNENDASTQPYGGVAFTRKDETVMAEIGALQESTADTSMVVVSTTDSASPTARVFVRADGRVQIGDVLTTTEPLSARVTGTTGAVNPAASILNFPTAAAIDGTGVSFVGYAKNDAGDVVAAGAIGFVLSDVSVGVENGHTQIGAGAAGAIQWHMLVDDQGHVIGSPALAKVAVPDSAPFIVASQFGANPGGDAYHTLLGVVNERHIDGDGNGGAGFVGLSHGSDGTLYRAGAMVFTQNATEDNFDCRFFVKGAGANPVAMARVQSDGGARFGDSGATGANERFVVMTSGGILKAWVNDSTGAWTDASDARMKENIADDTRGMDAVRALRPRTFKMRGQSGTHSGFVAQEVRDVLPEAVAGSETSGYGLTATPIVAVIVNALKEQDERIAKLEALVASLTGSAV